MCIRHLRPIANGISSGSRLSLSLLVSLAILLISPITRADYQPDWIWTGAGGSTGDCLLPPYYTPQSYDMTAWWNFGEFLDVPPTWSMSHCEQPGLVLSPSSCTDQGEIIHVLDYNDDAMTRYYGKGVSIATYYCAGFPNCKPGDRYKNPDGTFVRYFPDHVGGTCVGKTYDVIVSPASGGAIDTTYLAKVAPSGTLNPNLVATANLVARVFDDQGHLVPNIDVKLQLEDVPGSGGHPHDGAGNPSRPLGALATESSPGTVSLAGAPIPLDGSTGADGSGFAFTYEAPKSSGDYQISASCPSADCTQKGANTMWVGIPDLVSIPAASVYALVGGGSSHPDHPDNHYLTQQALAAVTILSALYHGKFPTSPVLHLNDSSLQRGGIFDIFYNYYDKQGRIRKRTAWWTSPHREHRLGIVIDIRANGTNTSIPARNYKAFEYLINHVIGGTFLWEPDSGHYHVRLLGPKG